MIKGYNLLPQMVGVSNNSRLTREVAEIIKEKLTEAELVDFQRWLRLVEDNSRDNVRNSTFKF